MPMSLVLHRVRSWWMQTIGKGGYGGWQNLGTKISPPQSGLFVRMAGGGGPTGGGAHAHKQPTPEEWTQWPGCL